MAAGGEEGGGGLEWESGVSRKVLLGSTGNWELYPMINHRGKEYEQVCIYVYIERISLLYSRN